jgi:hypothetical protein
MVLQNPIILTQKVGTRLRLPLHQTEFRKKRQGVPDHFARRDY